ncbi:unnamed protein product, partial [Staurois parvus]
MESKSRSVLSSGPLMVGMDLKQTRTRSRPLSRATSGRGNLWGCIGTGRARCEEDGRAQQDRLRAVRSQTSRVNNNGTKQYRTVDRESQVTGRVQQRKGRS